MTRAPMLYGRPRSIYETQCTCGNLCASESLTAVCGGCGRHIVMVWGKWVTVVLTGSKPCS